MTPSSPTSHLPDSSAPEPADADDRVVDPRGVADLPIDADQLPADPDGQPADPDELPVDPDAPGRSLVEPGADAVEPNEPA